MATPHPFDALIEHAAQIFASRLSSSVPTSRGGLATKTSPAKATASAKRPRSSWLKGKKLDMSCRVAGCKNKSGGPRHGFMCDLHQKLPKKEQQAARDAWKSRKA